MTFWAFSQLSACMLPEVSTTKMIHSLSTGMPPTAGVVFIFFGRVLEQALHLGRERLMCGDELGLDDVGDGGLALARLELTANLRQVAGERGGLSLLGSQDLRAALQLAVEHFGFAAQFEQLTLQVENLLLEILFAALDDDGLTDVGEHQQQDDGAETAADAVEERQREDFELAAFAQCHIRFLWPVARGNDVGPARTPREPPERMRRQRVALHGQQHDVDGQLAIRHLHRVFEQLFAFAAVDEFARRRHRALRGQAIGDEDDLVWLRDAACAPTALHSRDWCRPPA